MSDAEKLAAAQEYVRSAFASQGREMPEDLSRGLGVCLHWAQAGIVLGMKEWCRAMYGDEESDDSIVAFEPFVLYAEDGSVRKIG